MEPILQLNEFFVEGGDQQRSHVLLHITEPSTPEEKERGYFFAIVEINLGDAGFIADMQTYIDEIENNYYSVETGADKDPLEAVIEGSNQKILPSPTDKSKLHCVVGAIRGAEIVFTYAGSPHLLLFYKNRQDTFQTMNLIADPEGTENNQLFSQLVQGKISPGDYLVVATPEVHHYFNTDRLSKIVTSRPARQSAEHLQHALQGLRNGLSFGGLIIHLSAKEAEVAAPIKKRPPNTVPANRSYNSIFDLEKNTADTLSPSLFPRLNNKLKSLLDEEAEVPETNKAPAPTFTPAQINATHVRSPLPSKERLRSRAAVPFSERVGSLLHILGVVFGYLRRAIVWIFLLVIAIIQFIFRNIGMLFLVITNYQNRRQNILENWRRQWHSQKENVRRLPLSTKIIFVATIIGMAAFSASIVFLRYRQQKMVASAAAQSALELVKGKKDAAESALIYRNEESALANLKDATDALASVPCAQKEYSAECTTIQTGLNDLYAKVRKVTTVHPTLLTNWNNSALRTIAKAANLIVASSPVSGTLYRYDVSTKETGILPLSVSASGFSTSVVPKENDYILLGYNQDKLIKLTTGDGTIKTIDVSYPSGSGNITALNVYSRRLYDFDQSTKQIYKHDAIKTGFDQGKEWLRAPLVASGTVVSLAIDGDMFLLFANGDIKKFTKGEEQPFSVQGLAPPLTSANKMWTYADALYMYVLDTAGKRLILLDKDGKLQRQITATEFVAPSDMSIDETAGVAYVIDSGKLYQVSLK